MSLGTKESSKRNKRLTYRVLVYVYGALNDPDLIMVFYGALGFALFSRSGAYAFQTVEKSMSTIFEMGFTEGPSLADLHDMIGLNADFVGPDTDGSWNSMAEYSLAATIWFTTFYLAFSCLLLNLFIAIACTAYDEMQNA